MTPKWTTTSQDGRLAYDWRGMRVYQTGFRSWHVKDENGLHLNRSTGGPRVFGTPESAKEAAEAHVERIEEEASRDLPRMRDLRKFVRDIATLKASPAGEAICNSAPGAMLDTLISEAASLLRLDRARPDKAA